MLRETGDCLGGAPSLGQHQLHRPLQQPHGRPRQGARTEVVQKGEGVDNVVERAVGRVAAIDVVHVQEAIAVLAVDFVEVRQERVKPVGAEGRGRVGGKVSWNGR